MKTKLQWLGAITGLFLTGCFGEPELQSERGDSRSRSLDVGSENVEASPVAISGHAASPKNDLSGLGPSHDEELPLTPEEPFEEITWEDLDCGFEAGDIVTASMISEHVRKLEGKRVRIRGYLLADFQQKGISEFILLPRLSMSLGPAGKPDSLVSVQLKEGLTTEYKGSRLEHEVTGILEIDIFMGPDGTTWAIYHLHSDKVTIHKTSTLR